MSRVQVVQSEKYVVAVEVEMVIPADDPSEPCYEAETVQLLREIKEHADRDDLAWLTKHGKVYAALDPIDNLYCCLKDLPGDPLADLEAEHRLELLSETDRYIADLVAEVGLPSAAQRKRSAALAQRLARRPTRQKN